MALPRREPRDARRIDPGDRIRDPDAGDPALGHDLGERDQHEGPFQEARMRQDQIGLVQRPVVLG